MEADGNSCADKPAYVLQLEQVFGGPSQSSFGTAVFYDAALANVEDLESAALAKYRYFVGKNWDGFGSEAWLGAWKLVYTRPAGARPAIVEELKAVPDSSARLSAATMLEGHEQPQQAAAALAAAFDDGAVQSLRVYAIGDGAAMSGVLLAARRPPEGALFLVFLLD